VLIPVNTNGEMVEDDKVATSQFFSSALRLPASSYYFMSAPQASYFRLAGGTMPFIRA